MPPNVPTTSGRRVRRRRVAGEERRLSGVEDDRLDVRRRRSCRRSRCRPRRRSRRTRCRGSRRRPRPAAEASAKPTVTMSVQPWSTRLVDVRRVVGLRVGLDGDRLDAELVGGASRPSKPSWLNDLSSKPPASETMQGRKPSTAPPAAAVRWWSARVPTRSRQGRRAVRRRQRPPTNFLVVEMVNSRLHKRCPADFAGDWCQVTDCDAALAYRNRRSGANGYKDATRAGAAHAARPTRLRDGPSEHVAAAGELERVDDALDPLGVLARGDQQRVLGVDDDDVAARR